MPIKLNMKADWGELFYLKTDPEQIGWELTGVIKRPGEQLIYELFQNGETVEVYDFQVTKERDMVKVINNPTDPGDEDK